MRLVAAIVTAIVLAGCAGSGTAGPGPAVPPVPDAGEDVGAPGQAAGAITGTLGGDPGLEGGCAWLDTPEGRYEVLWPPDYRVQQQPLRLLGPDGQTVAEEGQRLTVEGEPATDALSYCQVGRLWQATAVTVRK